MQKHVNIYIRCKKLIDYVMSTFISSKTNYWFEIVVFCNKYSENELFWLCMVHICLGHSRHGKKS
jgi:hypothetical protein